MDRPAKPAAAARADHVVTKEPMPNGISSSVILSHGDRSLIMIRRARTDIAKERRVGNLLGISAGIEACQAAEDTVVIRPQYIQPKYSNQQPPLLARRSAASGRRWSKQRPPLMLREPDDCASQCNHALTRTVNHGPVSAICIHSGKVDCCTGSMDDLERVMYTKQSLRTGRLVEDMRGTN